MRNALLLSALFLSLAVSVCFAKPIDRRAPVRIAERFVKQNGYTEFTLSVESARHFTPESIEWTNDKIALLKQRHNTLQPRACGYAKKRKGGEPGWAVVFRYASDGRFAQNTKTGRAVTMNENGGAIRMEHVDAILKAFHPLKKSGL